MYARQRATLARQLQGDYGNRYVQRLVNHISQMPAEAVQPKLTVGPAGDRYEQEADRVAKQVMAAASLSGQGAAQRQGALEEEELQMKPLAQRQPIEEEELQMKPVAQRQPIEEEELQMKPVAQRQVPLEGGDVDREVENTIQQAKGGGQALPEILRSSMEGAFGADFSGVRVHTGPEADTLNDSMSARAFTTGQDIFLKRGEYDPHSTASKELLAHELTHVVQQGGASSLRKKQENKAGIAIPLKTGMDMSDAKVHYDSNKRLQRKSVPGASTYGNFVDLGNGQFGTTKVTDGDEVSGLVNLIRTKAAEAGEHQNIKVLTGTHGDQNGNLIGEKMFYTEDMAHEGHKVAEGGWITVLNVYGQSKETITGWMEPGSSAIILAWCFSKTSVDNWDNVHSNMNDAWIW